MINWNGVFMGTKEPDFRREDCPWINASHKKGYWRIQASSDAAVKTLRDHSDPTLASRRIGRAFHYLQDQTEVSPETRDRFSQAFPRSKFRDVADLILASIEKQSGGMTSGHLSFSKYWRDRTWEYSNYYDWQQILSAVDNLRKGFDRQMNNEMNAATYLPSISSVGYQGEPIVTAGLPRDVDGNALYASDFDKWHLFAWWADGSEEPDWQITNQAPSDALYSVAQNWAEDDVGYTFRRSLWVAANATYYRGGQTTVDGERKADLQKSSRMGVTASVPVADGHSIKLAWSRGVTTRIGGDFDTYGLVWQRAW